LFDCRIKSKALSYFQFVVLSMVRGKLSLVRRFLFCMVKLNRSNVNKKITFFYREYVLHINSLTRILKQNKIFFGYFLNIGLVLEALINWLLKPKCMLTHILNFLLNENMIFLDTWPYARKQDIFFCFFV